MNPQQQPFTEFVIGYFKSLGQAARMDYNTFTMAIFTVFCVAALGILRGLAVVTGLYAVLHMVAGGLNSLAQSIAFVGNTIRGMPESESE